MPAPNVEIEARAAEDLALRSVMIGGIGTASGPTEFDRGAGMDSVFVARTKPSERSSRRVWSRLRLPKPGLGGYLRT